MDHMSILGFLIEPRSVADFVAAWAHVPTLNGGYGITGNTVRARMNSLIRDGLAYKIDSKPIRWHITPSGKDYIR